MPIIILFLLGISLIGMTIFTISDRPVSYTEKLENDIIRMCTG